MACARHCLVHAGMMNRQSLTNRLKSLCTTYSYIKFKFKLNLKYIHTIADMFIIYKTTLVGAMYV